MNRTITHFAIYHHTSYSPHHASYSFHLSSPHRHNINQEDPYLLALCLDDTIPWPDTSPSFTAALYISVISVDSGRSLNLRALRIRRLDEVEEIDE